MMREKGDGTIINGIIYGEKIVDAALAAARRAPCRADVPVLGTIDTHGPWIARKPWIDIYSPGRYTGPFSSSGRQGISGFGPVRWVAASFRPPRTSSACARSTTPRQLPGQAARAVRRAAEVVGDLGSDDAAGHRDHGEEFFEDPPLWSRRLAPWLARARPADRPRPGPLPRRTIVGGGRRSVDLLADPCSDAVGRAPIATSRCASARAARAGASAAAGRDRRTLAVRVRACDADRSLEDPCRQDGAAVDRRSGRGSDDGGTSPRRSRSSAGC